MSGSIRRTESQSWDNGLTLSYILCRRYCCYCCSCCFDGVYYSVWVCAFVCAGMFVNAFIHCACRVDVVFVFAYAYLRWIIAFTGFSSLYLPLDYKHTQTHTTANIQLFKILPCIFSSIDQFSTGWQNNYFVWYAFLFSVSVRLWHEHFLTACHILFSAIVVIKCWIVFRAFVVAFWN